MKFHDGTPCTSADVKATYDRLRNPPQGVVSTRKATFADIASIETPDPVTVVFQVEGRKTPRSFSISDRPGTSSTSEGSGERPDLAKTHINGTGAFTFVEHVKGSHVAGKRNENYFKKGLPYLGGFKGVFFLQAATMLNALQGGQVQAEFRSISEPEKQRLIQTMGDKIRIQESSWTLNLLVCFNVEKKPFDDPRVAPRAGHGHRPLGRQQGPRADFHAALGRRRLRPGYPLATPEAELVKLPGFSKDIAKSRAEAKKILADAGLKDLKFVLHNRSIAQPYTPAGVFLVDQWRQIGVTVENKQQETAPYLAGLNSGNYDVAIDFSNLFMDDPSLALAKYLSIDRSPDNRSRSKDPELDKLYDAQMRELDPKKRQALIQAFEKRLFEQAYQQPLLWWYRMVPTHKTLMGWRMSPSHNLGQDLSDVWLKHLNIAPAARPNAGRGRITDAALYHKPCPAHDSHATRRGGPRVLYVAHRSRRHRRGEAARRRRCRDAGNHRNGAAPARARQSR